MIRRAMLTSQQEGIQNVKWIEGDVSSGVLGDDVLFDGVLLRYTATHVKEIQPLLRLLYQHLSPGGRIWIIDAELDHMMSDPPNRAFDAYLSGTYKFYSTFGIDGHVGSKVFNLLPSLGFRESLLEIDEMSNRALPTESLQRYMLHEARLFKAYNETSLSQEDIDHIGKYVEDDIPRSDYYFRYGVVMISARK